MRLFWKKKVFQKYKVFSQKNVLRFWRLSYSANFRRSRLVRPKKGKRGINNRLLEKILEVEKNCAFENVTAAELLASKFLSLIGKSTGDYELKKKLRKSDMSVEAKTEAIHEYMYEKLNDSPDTEDEKKFRHVEKRNKTHQRTNRPEHKVQNSKL